MILTEVKNHPIAYAVLILGIVIFCYSFFSVWPNHIWERILIIGFSLYYFIWGVVTHKLKKQMTARVLSEYAVVAFIGALLLLMLTF